ncbi:unnamed protein product [Sphagnum balticum]
MAEQEKMQALVRSREKKLLLVGNKYHLCGFDDQASASGSGQWRGLEIGSCEEEAASSAGSEAACQIEETRISTGKELEVTIQQQQQQWCFPQGLEEHEQEQQEKDFFDLLPDHLVIEILVRVATPNWPMLACVHRRWAAMFRGDGLWQTALTKRWPHAGSAKRWPGPISRGSSKRRYTALHASDSLLTSNSAGGENACGNVVDEVVGHVYLFLKEKLELAAPSCSYGLLHGTMIDQFLACGKKSDEAHDLASQIWVVVLGNLEESESTFHLLMRIAEEWEVFLPYPYSKSHAVQWRLFERLFTDFRDCLSQFDYFHVLSQAKHKFELIPPAWLGY